jgi:hypothetical protein
MTNQRDDYFELKRTVRAETGVRDVSDIRAIQGARIKTLAAAVQDEVTRWCAPYPTFLLNRVPSLSVTCAGMFPDADVGVVATVVKLPVLLFAVDDIVDGTRVVPRDDEADSLLVVCGDIVRAAGSLDIEERRASLTPGLSPGVLLPWTEVGHALKRYCAELTAMPRARLFYPFFVRMFGYCMDGMRSELSARRTFIDTGEVPEYDAYMNSGRVSVGAPALFASALCAVAPEMDESELCARWSALDELVFAGGSCVRLANDVRSFAREMEIEQRPNSMVVLMRKGPMSEEAAEKLAISRADEHLSAMRPLVQALPEALQPWAAGVERFTSLIRDWFMVRELHD